MDDLLEMSQGGDDKHHERFKKIIVTIGERVSQANAMAMYLNRVARRMAHPTSTFNVNDLLNRTCKRTFHQFTTTLHYCSLLYLPLCMNFLIVLRVGQQFVSLLMWWGRVSK